MKRRTLLYIPLVLLAMFAFSALAVHYRNLFINQDFASRQVDLPFTNRRGFKGSPEAEARRFQRR